MDECFVEDFYEVATDAKDDEHCISEVSSDTDAAEASGGVGAPAKDGLPRVADADAHPDAGYN